MKLHRTLEVIANISIVVVGAAILYVVASKYMLAPTEPKVLQLGDTLPLRGTAGSANGRTVALFLEEGCASCENSAQFHKRVVVEVKGQQGRAIAVFPRRSTEGDRHARDLGVEENDVVDADIRSLGIHRVPSIVIIGSSGVVQRFWIGKLTEKQENEVLMILRSSVL
jgi:hypothetical protein